MPAPRQRHLPLLDVPPGVSVLPLDELPAMGTALPVVMESDACRGRGLPALGSWVKLKVVGLAAVKVRAAPGGANARENCALT
jgi:hypothetical protein